MKLEQIGILVGILSAVFTGLYFIIKTYNEQRKKIRTKLTGQWQNEGDIIWTKFETHFVKLDLEVDNDDGEIIGTIQSRCVKSETSSPLCSINGKLKYRSAIIEISHVKHGEKIVYGKAKIKLKKKILFWDLKNGIADFFPERTRLQSTTFIMF